MDKSSVAIPHIEPNFTCPLEFGAKTTITDAGFTKHEFSYMGLKLYTVREGLKRVR